MAQISCINWSSKNSAQSLTWNLVLAETRVHKKHIKKIGGLEQKASNFPKTLRGTADDDGFV